MKARKRKLWLRQDPYNLRKTNENFADGKKGKADPKSKTCRCKLQDLTSLRAKAKKASGEKAKMYHWCANMKGGKKK